MNYIGKLITNVREFCNEINSATLTGAIDVVVVQQPDGTFSSSPFHVRFGKIGVLRSREKIVDIEINGEPVDIHMKLGESGEAFFVEEVLEQVPDYLATSPLPDIPDIGEELDKLKASIHNEGLSEVIVIENEPKEPPPKSILKDSSTFDNQLQAVVTENGVGAADVKPAVPLVPSSELTNGATENNVLNKTSSHEDSSSSSTSSKRTNKQKASVAVQTDVLITGYIDVDDVDMVDNVSYSPLPAVVHVAPAVEDNRQGKKKYKKKKHVVRKHSRVRTQAPANQEPIGSSLPAHVESLERLRNSEQQEIFQMDSDYDDDRDAVSGVPPAMSRSVTMPVGMKSLDDTWLPPKRMTVTYNGEFHPFSDGEISPIHSLLFSPSTSRPPSPKSDTEYENQKMDAISQTDNCTISWTWGELPIIPSWQMSDDRLGDKRDQLPETKLEVISSDDEYVDKMKEENRSVLGGMLNFMKSNNKIKHAIKEGIYLDDLDPRELDPQVAALYFPKFRSPHLPKTKDDDLESGNGPSLSQSPHSDGVLGGLQSFDSDTEERHAIFDYCSKRYNDLAMSLCGGLQDNEGTIPEERFLHFLITYDDFCENPDILNSPDLVIRMGGKYYNWNTVSPHLLSLAMFQRPLPEKTLNRLTDMYMPKKKKKSGYSWWSWRRTEPEKGIKAMDQEGHPSSVRIYHEGIEEDDILVTKEVASETHQAANLPKHSTPNTQKIAHKDEPYTSTSSEAEMDQQRSTEQRRISRDRRPYYQERYKKSLRLSSDQIKSLRLKEGPNEAVFSVTTAYQGTTRSKCHIYLWRYDDKIVISDIDGTITKSDVLGHILPRLGKDWAQSGVARLFTKICNNGYRFLYLSARAIGQAHTTREYLRSVRQGDVWLPDGPVLLSPTSLIIAFHREVIEKKPEEFKISCLRDIQALFNQTNENPFYAGFGNKINDTLAYRAVGIPVSRIFTINHRGELKLELMQNFLSSYNCLSDVVDHVFPPLLRASIKEGNLTTTFAACEEFSSFTYWRDPIPALSESEVPQNNDSAPKK